MPVFVQQNMDNISLPSTAVHAVSQVYAERSSPRRRVPEHSYAVIPAASCDPRRGSQMVASRKSCTQSQEPCEGKRATGVVANQRPVRRSGVGPRDLPTSHVPRRAPKSNARWEHNLYIEEDQAPKSRQEIIAVYGFDIRTCTNPLQATVLERGRGSGKSRNLKYGPRPKDRGNIHSAESGDNPQDSRGGDRGRGRGGGQFGTPAMHQDAARAQDLTQGSMYQSVPVAAQKQCAVNTIICDIQNTYDNCDRDLGDTRVDEEVWRLRRNKVQQQMNAALARARILREEQERLLENKRNAAATDILSRRDEIVGGSKAKEESVVKKTEEMTEEQKAAKRAKPVSCTPVPETPWCVVWTGDGRVFFYNPTTRYSTWERPEVLKGCEDVGKMLQQQPDAVADVA